jgi:hypothetical protein
MQTAAPVNGVLVGETTYRATRDVIEFRGAAPVAAKGKAEAVRVWEAVDPIARSGIDVVHRARTPLVGRERELELLRSILARVRDDQAAQLVTLVGVPGIGKSRLVAELFASGGRTDQTPRPTRRTNPRIPPRRSMNRLFETPHASRRLAARRLVGSSVLLRSREEV